MYKLENEDKWKLDSLKFNGMFVVTVKPYLKFIMVTFHLTLDVTLPYFLIRLISVFHHQR